MTVISIGDVEQVQVVDGFGTAVADVFAISFVAASCSDRGSRTWMTTLGLEEQGGPFVRF